MVAKIGHGTSLFGAISYNKLKVDDENGKVLFAQNIIEQADGTYQMPDILHSFEPYLSANKRTEKPIIHISLNPNPTDKVTDENFIKMAQQYMDELGFGEQPYIVFKHTDIDRTHIHIVSVRVKADGSCISDAYEKRRSMNICRKLEQEFNLTPADKQERQNVLPLQKVDYSKGDVKRQVANAVRELAKSYRFQSFSEYRALLSFFNLTAEEVKSEHKGKPYNGLVYSVLNKKGEKVGNPFKSSLFGKSVGCDALYKRMDKEKQTWKMDKATKNRLRADILKTITESKKRKSFEKNLLNKGISVVFRENEQGRIYGVTFIDHTSKTVLNLDQLELRIEELMNGVADVAEEAKEEYNQHIDKLKGLKEEMSEKLAKFDEIAESKWDVVKDSASNFFSQVNDAWKENYAKVSSAFKKGAAEVKDVLEEGDV